MTRWFAILYFIVATLFLLFLPHVGWTQHNHAQHHPDYKNWTNQRDKNCCNNQDCGELKEDDERTTPTGVEVKVEGEWCKIQDWHYLKRGNAPNWASSHVCVLKAAPWQALTPVCDRLLCYQPKPGI